MNVLIAELKSIILTLTLSPATTPLVVVTLALALAAAWFGFSKIITALKFPMNSGWRPIASLLIFITICLAAAVVTKAHLSPRISSAAVSRFLPLAIALALFLAAVIPLSCYFMKSHYLQTLSAFLVPVLAAAIVVFLAKGATGAIKHGGKGFFSTKERTEGVDELIDR